MTNLVQFIGNTLNQLFPSRSRLIKVDGEPYLRRFYLKHSGILPGLYLHYFYRGDRDRELHNHPWRYSFSLILKGGYKEERLVNNKVRVYHYKAGDVNIIKANDFHRVVMPEGVNGTGVWTLFCSGKKVQDWGFIDPNTGEFIDWQTYEENKSLKKRYITTDLERN